MHVGGRPVRTTAYRLPEVAVGQNPYIPIDASYDDGTFLGFFRVLAGSHVDLTDTYTGHSDYVKQVTVHARGLQELGYLLKADADAIILRKKLSNIGG